MNNKLIVMALAIVSCGVEVGAMMTESRTPQVVRQTSRPTGESYRSKMTRKSSDRGAQGRLISSEATTPHAGRTSVTGVIPSRGIYASRASVVAPYAERGVASYAVDTRPTRVLRTGGLGYIAGRRGGLAYAYAGRRGRGRASSARLGSLRKGASFRRGGSSTRATRGRITSGRTTRGRTRGVQRGISQGRRTGREFTQSGLSGTQQGVSSATAARIGTTGASTPGVSLR